MAILIVSSFHGSLIVVIMIDRSQSLALFESKSSRIIESHSGG